MTISTRHFSFTDISKGFLYLLTLLALSLSHLSHGQSCATSECSPEESKEIMQEMYVAYYGRPAEPAGLQYWADRLSADSNLDDILAAFGTSAEYNDNYGQLTNAELIKGLYQQMFNRDPDPSGLEFYTNRLESGEASLASIAKQIADGALNSDAETLDNKVALASKYSNGLPDDLCGYTGCNYNWPTIKSILTQVDDGSDPQVLANLHTQAFKLAKGENAICEKCIWQDDSQSFSLTGQNFLVESLTQTTLDFLKTIEISKTIEVHWMCMEATMVFPHMTIIDQIGSSQTFRPDPALGCHEQYISSNDFYLLIDLLQYYMFQDGDRVMANEEPEYSIAVDRNFASPTTWFEVGFSEDDEDYDTYEPSLWVYKNRGALTCLHTGISPEESKQSLLNASIEVGKTACGYTGGGYQIAGCNYPTEDIVLHQIGQSRLAFAEELGYKSIYSLQQEMETEDVYMQVNCD